MMAEEQTTETEGQGTVPKNRLDREIEKRRAAEQELSDLRGRLEKLEDAGKTDVERLTKELERERSRAAENEGAVAELQKRLEQGERSSMIRAAAEKANLVDAEAAVAFANIDEIADAADAKKYVERLAKDRPYLVKQESAVPPLERVFGPAGQQGEPPVRIEDMDEHDVKRLQGEAILAEVNKSRAIAGLEPILPGAAGAAE